MASKRIGILTGGGDCPGLNAAIRAVTKSAIGNHNWEVLGIETGFEGLIKKNVRQLTLENVRGILNRGGTILGATRRHDPFHYVEHEASQEGKPQDRSDLILKHAAELGLEGLVVVGGDGTLKIAERLFRAGLPSVAVPKTIDNDVPGTDVSIGFDTAVVTAMEALDKVHTTAESHNRVMVVEVMGNKAGWIGMESGISGGADVILIPEIPFDIAKACEKIVERKNRGRPFSVVVAAEGAKPVGKRETYIDPERRRLGGIGHAVAAEIERCTQLETRVIVLGHLQRGGGPDSFDRVLASRFGVHAVELIAAGNFGKMIAYRKAEVCAIPLKDAVAGPNTVDPDGDLAFTAEALDISLGR
jgi:6-phosphofructokinase 1